MQVGETQGLGSKGASRAERRGDAVTTPSQPSQQSPTYTRKSKKERRGRGIEKERKGRYIAPPCDDCDAPVTPPCGAGVRADLSRFKPA